jgi:hypothetical protein
MEWLIGIKRGRMISVGYLTEHSLDNNDFESKQIYEQEVRGIRIWKYRHSPIMFNSKEWVGYLGKYDLQPLELIQYEE